MLEFLRRAELVIYKLVEGVRIESLDNSWASFSMRSGETLLLNTEAAAVLELLSNGPASSAELAQTLAADCGSDAATVNETLRHTWDQLLNAGLVEVAGIAEHNRG